MRENEEMGSFSEGQKRVFIERVRAKGGFHKREKGQNGVFREREHKCREGVRQVSETDPIFQTSPSNSQPFFYLFIFKYLIKICNSI